jgi:hypothetical protein
LIRQANIINGSQRQNNHIKKTIPKLTPNNSSSSTSTSSSNHLDSAKAKNQSRPMIDIARRQKPKLMKSSSAENSSTMTSEKETTDGECEYFHLPPVLGNEPSKANQSAASSTRPNVDSESSAFSSDTDDQKSFRSRVPTTPPIHPVAISTPPSPIEIVIRENENGDVVDDDDISFTPPLPPLAVDQPVAQSIATIENSSETIKKDEMLEEPAVPRRSQSPINPREAQKATLTIIDNSNGISLQPTINIETEPTRSPKAIQPQDTKIEPIEADKLSTISKTSAKTSSDSINTLSSNNEERQVHSSHTNYHTRNRSGARKLGPPLVRSQTARNLLSNASNQQTGANNQVTSQKKESKKETDKDREQGEMG